MPYLQQYSKDIAILKENLAITSTYSHVLSEFEDIVNKENAYKSVDEILNDLIYEYETKEQVFQSDNLKNEIIIKCNGNKEEADKLYEKQKSIYSDKTDLVELLGNIIIYREEYKISNATQKLALALQKTNIMKAYDNINSNLNEGSFNLEVNGFMTKTTDGRNTKEIQHELNLYAENEFKDEDKDLIIILLILNIIGIVGIFITLKNKILSALIIAILLIGNTVLLIKLHNRTTLRDNSIANLKDTINQGLEPVLAETIDYKDMLEEDKAYYDQLQVFLNNISPTSYINSNNERNIMVGEQNE
jgi:hypothetical protein